jgi:hypothetical protein
MSTSKHASELEHANGPAPENRKRKPSETSDVIGEDSPKRARHENNGRTYYEARSRSPVTRRGSSPDRAPPNEPARRPSATTEEKKRGKRLFGGLLNTLSQTNTNNQQRRRQEIEKRQHDKLHKQKAEDDQKRAERYAQVRNVRMAEQIGFEKRVV